MRIKQITPRASWALIGTVDVQVSGTRVNIEGGGRYILGGMMSVIYIGQSQAKPDEIDNFLNFMTSVVRPGVQTSAGCESYQLFQSQADPTQFIGIEVWTSVEAHRASVKNIPLESIAEFMRLVAVPPSGGYYRNV